jgi:hypothetical protein
MESVLSRTGKVLLDAKAANSLMYLPLDRILEQAGTLRGLQRDYSPGEGTRVQPQAEGDASRARQSR